MSKYLFNFLNHSTPSALTHESFVTFVVFRDCEQVNELPWLEKCNFTKLTADCRVEERILDYTSFIFCGQHPEEEWLKKLLLVRFIH